jgi:hypothetical protein
MSVYRSGGLVYVGVDIYVGQIGNPYDYRISEIYEFTELPWEWDVVDFTSHDASLPQHGHTRTAKPGLGVQSTLSFKGIWMDEDLYTFRIHDYLQDNYRLRRALEWDIAYSFAEVQNGVLDYRGIAYITQYVLTGDLGDKFAYTCQLLFEGEPQQVIIPPPEYERIKNGVKNRCKEAVQSPSHPQPPHPKKDVRTASKQQEKGK